MVVFKCVTLSSDSDLRSFVFPKRYFKFSNLMKPVTPFCIARLRICCCCYMEGFPSPNVSMETPPKSTLAGEVVSLLSQDHRLPAFWCRHMI